MMAVEREDLQEKLNGFLKRLVSQVEIDDHTLETYTVEACRIYEDGNFRHSYAEISRILESLQPDQQDYLSHYVAQMRDSCFQILEEQGFPQERREDIQKSLFKLCDHVELECIRLGRMKRVEYIEAKASKALEDADNKLRSVEEKASELGDRVTDYHAQSISILGIFSGLVVTVSGVLQFTASGLQNLSNVDTGKIVLFLAVSFLFLFNVVFMLMYCISRIAGTSLAADCRNRNCTDCGTCKWRIKMVWKKYPYVFCFNLLGIAICVLAFLYCTGFWIIICELIAQIFTE